MQKYKRRRNVILTNDNLHGKMNIEGRHRLSRSVKELAERNLYMKRFIYLALILSLFLLLTISCVNAADLPISGNYNITEEEAIEEALRYLNDYTTMTFLYEDTALVDYPARLDEELGEMSISLPADTFACATNTREYLNPDTLTDHTEYLAKKAKYWKAIREVQNIIRDDFAVNYELLKVNVSGNYAQVCVLEEKTYFYRGETIKTYDSDTFEVFLVKVGGSWRVFDMYTDDGFDTEYHDAVFDVDAKINAFTKMYQSLPEDEPVIIPEEPTDGTVEPNASYSAQMRSYNKNNAVNYAFTYSKQDTDNAYGYYNKNYIAYREEEYYTNSDCMNFVSQCLHAGFYGSNDYTSIRVNKDFPQDKDGTLQWKVTDGPWYAISSFRDYLSYCETASGESYMTAQQSLFDAYSGINATAGCVALVKGTAGDFGHAVLIDTVNGTSRDKIYFTGHTSDKKHAQFSDYYNSCKVRIITPVSMTEIKPCTGGNGLHGYSTFSSVVGVDATCYRCGYCKLYIKNTLQNCVAQGRSLQLSSTTNQKAYRMSAKVALLDSNGNETSVTWMGESTYTNSFSFNYTFTQKGLYAITVYARDIDPTYPASVSVSSTYTIRCY